MVKRDELPLGPVLFAGVSNQILPAEESQNQTLSVEESRNQTLSIESWNQTLSALQES